LPCFEGDERVVELEPVSEYEATVGDLDVVTLGLRREEELVSQRLILEQEAMIGRDENVGGVGASQLLHQIDDVS